VLEGEERAYSSVWMGYKGVMLRLITFAIVACWANMRW
jgi:hypothetical protein